jgi:hypothetical protein
MTDTPERDVAIAERDKAVGARDEARAELDFILEFVREMLAALDKGRLVETRPAGDGVEVRTLFPSLVSAFAAPEQIEDLVAMGAKAGGAEAQTTVH